MRHGFWPLALLRLPAGIAAQAAVRFGPSVAGFAGSGEALAAAGSLAVAAPCNLPLAIASRRLRRLRHRRTAWIAGTAFGALTVAASVSAGLLSLPVCIAWLRLARNG